MDYPKAEVEQRGQCRDHGRTASRGQSLEMCCVCWAYGSAVTEPNAYNLLRGATAFTNEQADPVRTHAGLQNAPHSKRLFGTHSFICEFVSAFKNEPC